MGERLVLRIGYDTLVENPVNPSSAINYLVSVLRTLVEVGPDHQYFVFVSPKNRHLFNLQASNVTWINCFVSNENIPLRILAQQILIPIYAWRYKLDVLYMINQLPLFSPCATVVKTASLHHHLEPETYKHVPLRLWWRRFIFDVSARRATRVIANTSSTKTEICRLMKVSPDKVDVVFEAVSESFGCTSCKSEYRELVRRDYGLERDYILFVSDLWPYKNPDGAIRAFARQYADYHDDLDLVFVGPDEYMGMIPGLRELARSEGVNERVHFLGRIPNEKMIPLYCAATVMFYPSFAETFGKPVIEAMRCNLPVVTARSSCLPEIVGDAGLLVDPRNIEEMAKALHQAATDQALRRDFIERGIRRCSEFSWHSTAMHTLETWARAAALHKRPSTT